jgi:glycosyltransferase involved in cell wall biosynthesis
MRAGQDIIIDVSRLTKRLLDGRMLTGIDRVGLAYVGRYGKGARAALRWRGRHYVFSRASSQKLFDRILARQRLSFPSLVALYMKGRLQEGRARTESSVLLNVSHSGLETPGYIESLRVMGVRPVFMLHDLIPISHPEYVVMGERERHLARVGNMLDGAAAIITNSRATLEALSAFAANSNVPMPPARATLLGTQPLAPGAAPPVTGPYFVVLGTIEPRKNHLLLLNVWRALAQTTGERLPRLVIIGQRGWECENVADMIERCAVLRDHVIELPSCSDGELSAWLAGARALLFPSFAEGFGLPLCEALSLGVPVLAADLPVFREAAGDIPEYLDPIDGVKWAEVIAEYADPGSPRAAAQKARMRGFSPPSWDAHFKVVDEVLLDVEQGHG